MLLQTNKELGVNMEGLERTIALLKLARIEFVDAMDIITPMSDDENTLENELEKLELIEDISSAMQNWAKGFIELRNEKIELIKRG